MERGEIAMDKFEKEYQEFMVKLADKVNAGEIDLLNYYTKSEIDKTVDDINTRLEDVEDFIKNPIQTTELEIITNTDLNNDNKIG